MTAALRFSVALLLAGLSACEPYEGSGSLLESHQGGLVAQSAKDGSILAASSLPAAGASSGEAATQPSLGIAAVAFGGADIAAAESLSAAAESVEAPAAVVPVAATAGLEGSAAAEQEEQLQGKPAPAAVSGPPQVAGLADELNSGEFAGGALVSQALVGLGEPAVLSADGPAPGAEKAEPLATGAVEAKLPVEVEVGTDSDQQELSETAASTVESGVFDGSAVPGLDGVLPESPSSDELALAALDTLRRSPAASGASQPQPLWKAPDMGLLAVPLGQLSMVRAWLDGTLLRAELRGPDGKLYTVVRGDRVGSDGGRVLQVSSSQVVVGEIGFGLDGQPFIVQEAIR
ncbi:MAG: hypothetical protein CMP23_16575 [Rickettsiales bacterium]|nr:hypothetical protein [Rickettsiales bacterium]